MNHVKKIESDIISEIFDFIKQSYFKGDISNINNIATKINRSRRQTFRYIKEMCRNGLVVQSNGYCPVEIFKDNEINDDLLNKAHEAIRNDRILLQSLSKLPDKMVMQYFIRVVGEMKDRNIKMEHIRCFIVEQNYVVKKQNVGKT